uniref:Uncharacterized protein n=1 Tax=Arion vulgaris TaxID=1028688 RepID=A0A0B7BIP3_9EUPU
MRKEGLGVQRNTEKGKLWKQLKDGYLIWETIGRKAAEQQQWKSHADALCVKRDTKRI